jgi:indolepyruvate ferredoxin oxidoreductase alpha subunit
MPDLSSIPFLPLRPPSLCKGCPHTETYGAVKEALRDLDLLDRTIFPTDIGCYTLGLLPPIQMADYVLCMGSSVGSSAGFSASTDQKIVSFIGDSTFFHSGIPSLINAVHNNHCFCLVILDNSTTAMTGHQPNPGIELTPPGYDHPRIPIEDVVRACGVRNVLKINPYRKKESVEALKELLAGDELAVVISEAPCVLYVKRVGGKK